MNSHFDQKAVIALSGRKGSGKSSLATALADSFGWIRASFGDYVRTVAASQGLSNDVQVLQQLGEFLILSRGHEGFCRDMLASTTWTPGQSLVVDGVRHVDIRTALRDAISPMRFVHVHVQVREEEREARMRLRVEGITSEQLAELERHSTEIDVPSLLAALADLIVDGELPTETIIEQIRRFV